MDSTLQGVDPYKVLGVPKNANAETIRKAYRRLATKLHPDVGGDANEFAILSLCYAVLMDPEKREYYDRTGTIRGERQIDKEAIDLLRSLFDHMIDTFKERILQTDMIVTLKQALSDTIRSSNQRIGLEKAAIDRYKKISAKLKRKSEAGEQIIFEVVLDQKIQQANASIANCEAAREVAARAKELADLYEWDFVSLTTFTTTPWKNMSSASYITS